MTNSFTQVFGGTTIYPADVSYLALALTGNISLEWPLEATAGSSVVARIIDITPSGAYTITMPEATSVSVGQTVLFNNIGPSTVAVNKANGSAILSIGAGEQWQAYLIDNTTPGGTWRTLRYGAATAQAQAAALAGPGLVTDGSQLAQNYEVIDFSVTPYTLTAPDRAKVFIWDGGLGTLNLPSAPAAGDGWFVQVRNAGQGDLTVDPSGSELINAGSTLLLQPGDSAVIVSNGTQWYTIGLGQQAVFAFDYTSIAVTGGTYTLTGSELNRIAYKFTGALASNVTIVVPATVQQYWVNNSTTGPFTLSLQASGSGSSTPVTQSSTSILYCDGTAIVPATTAVTFAGILPVSQGGTGANNAPSARTNLGATGIGSSLFTATSAASARSTISAASSGANSDITSLSGLTTPLSVGQGGTGAATLTANGVVVGNGTSALLATAAGTTGQVLVGNTGGAPSWATLTGIGVTSFSGGTTGLTPASPTTGAITLAGTLGVANGGTGNTTFLSNYLLKGNGTSAVTSSIVYDNGTNVGIATSSPTERLTVAGNTKIGEGVASNTSKLMVNTMSGVAAGIQLIQDANESWIIQNPASSTALTFSASGAERMRITTGGFVGIGTSSPGTRLDVSGGDVYRISRVSTATGGIIEMGLLGQSIIGIQSLTNASNFQSLILNPNGGNVGIGTTSPVSGGLLTVGSGSGTSTAFQYLEAGSGGAALIGRGSGSETWLVGDAKTAFGSGTGLVNFAYGANPILFATNSSERMRITGAGNVGIGTTTPAVPLDVRGSVAIGSSSSSYLIANYNSEILAGVDAGGYYYASGFGAASNIPITMGDRASYIAFKTSPSTAAGFERMRITGTGDVGIGTGTPSSILEILRAGDSLLTITGNTASGNVAGVDFKRTTGTVNASVRSQSVGGNDIGELYFSTRPNAGSLTERMRIDSSGNVGIGASPSSARLTVDSGASAFAAVFNSTDNTFIQLRNSGTNALYIQSAASAAYLWNQLNTPFLFGTNNTERMRITSAGDVGIGNSAPGARLSVLGGALSSVTDLSLNISSPLTTGRMGTYDANTASAIHTVFDSTSVELSAGSTSGWVSGISVTGNNAVNYKGTIRFATTSVERARIDSAGNVMIGTTTSYNKLNIGDDGNGLATVGLSFTTNTTERAFITMNGSSGEMRISAGFPVYGGFSTFYTAGTERMRIDSSGNVGIGTSSPTARLDVSGGNMRVINTTATSQIIASNTGGILALGRDSSTGGSFGSAYSSNLYSDGAYPLLIWTNATERMRIDSSGNVGIGTSSPNARLHVAGSFQQVFTNSVGGTTLIGAINGASNGYEITVDTSNNITHQWRKGDNNPSMTLVPAGSLGIGTTTPTSKLHVNSAGSTATEVLVGNANNGAGIGVQTGGTPILFNFGAKGMIFGGNFNTTFTEQMRIDGFGNLLVGTTSANGSMANTATTNSGVFNTLSGTVSAASGAATTIATANQNYASATYIVSCSVSSGAPNFYSAVAIVSADNNVLRITNLQTATNMTISISGTNIQATQTSGGTTTIIYSLIRIG